MKHFLIRCPVIFLTLAVLSMAPPTAAAADANDIFVTQLRDYLGALAKTDGLSGVVLVAKDGKPVFDEAYGYANLADSVPNTIDTKFNMGSMGKMITAVAVMQLVEAGKIGLNEKVGKYLPAYPNAAVRDKVTVEELLTHTSGMGNFWAQIADKAKDRYRALSDYVPLFADEKLQFEPGKGFAYSNNGFTVLGLIIEAVSGRSYFDYVRDNIYQPCGMADTDAYDLDEPVSHMAIAYSRSPDKPGHIVDDSFSGVIKGSAAGGSFATAGDMLKLANALMSSRLLNRKDTDMLTRGKVDYGTRRYGYGFTEETVNGHRIIGHGGGGAGVADELLIFTDLGYTVVILTNGDVDNFWQVENFVKRSLAGPSPQTESSDFTLSLIATTRSGGYGAGVKALAERPNHPPVRAGMLEQAGYKLLWESNTSSAAAIFRLYVLASPQDAYAWLGLGAADERAGDAPGAIAAYTKYLDLEPDDADVKAKLQKLSNGSKTRPM